MYNIPMIANKMTRRTSSASWAPVPTTAERRAKLRGGRKTSPWTSFHPDSSLTSLSWEQHKHIHKYVGWQVASYNPHIIQSELVENNNLSDKQQATYNKHINNYMCYMKSPESPDRRLPEHTLHSHF